MKEGRAFPMRKGETGLADDDYVFLEKFLDVTKSNLFFAKSVLIVEGDGENILLPTISKLLGRPLEDYGVSIVNVGNTAYARYAKIFLRKEKNSSDNEWLPIRVACLRDLDLWPKKADCKVTDFGFKEVNNRNKHLWLPRLDAEGKHIGTDPKHKKLRLEKFFVKKTKYSEIVVQPQYVRVLVSDEWTFEYCLIRSGLDKEIYTIINDCDDGYDDLAIDNEEKAIKIYGMIEAKSSGKTEVAYKLNEKLNEMFGGKDKKEELRALLPKYILDAIEYVTKEFPDDLDVEDVNQAIEVSQQAGIEASTDTAAEPDVHANE